MAETVKCFWVEPTLQVSCFLRRYQSRTESSPPCTGPYGYHDAMFRIEDRSAKLDARGILQPADDEPHEDPRWPTACVCGYVFQPDDTWQVFQHRIYRRPDTMETWPSIEDCPPGAIFHAYWHDQSWPGPDGRCLAVRMPGEGRKHIWIIDGPANNCDMKADRKHRCWCRHGDVPKITVDKRGDTCGAGGGSIAIPGWHGFLVDGELRPC